VNEVNDQIVPEAGEVGYGKPPLGTRFKLGRSGNPKGRPKGKPNLATALEKELREKVVINEGGKRKVISKLEAALKQLVNKAAGGDLAALRQLSALARSVEDRPAEQTNSNVMLSEVDGKVMQRVLERYSATIGGSDGKTEADSYD
jgi:hypothetical protein